MTEGNQLQPEMVTQIKPQEYDKSDKPPEIRGFYGITMELPMFLTMMSITLSTIAVNNVLLYRTCIHTLNYEEEVCREFLEPAHSNVTQELETEVQGKMLNIQLVKVLLESFGPATLSFFLGAWSDKHGRKPLVAGALFGLGLSQIMVVIYSALHGLGPWFFIITGIPNAIAGYTVLFTGAMCYMADITTVENRSLRLTIVQVLLSIGSIVGQLSSSYLMQLIGGISLLALAALCTVTAFLFTTFFLKESLKGAEKGGFTSVLKFSLLKKMFHACFKRRPNNGRAQILLLIMANTLPIFMIYGLYTLDYLYTRNKLQWSMRDFTIFNSFTALLGCIGGFVGVAYVQKALSVPDLAFIIFAFFSATVENVVKAFATAGWHLYIGAGISFFSNLSAPLIRSVLSKMIPATDIAKVFALMGSVEGTSPLFANVLYNSLYNATLEVFPGAIYILSAGLCFSCVITVGIVQYYQSRMVATSPEDEK